MGKYKNDRSSEIFNRMKLMRFEKKKAMTDFDYTAPKGFLKGLINGVKEADVSSAGAQLAYFFLLSLFPLLIFLLTLLPFLNLPQEQVFTMLENILPEQVFSLIESTIKDVLSNRNGGLLSVGIIATLWSASNGVNALIKNLNKSYDITETRPFIVARAVSIFFTVLLIGLIIVALVLPVFGKTIGQFMFEVIGLKEGFLIVWNYVRIIIPPFLIVTVLVLLYWIAPNVKIYFRHAIPGALFATIAWVLISFGFSFYISNFANYSKTYGSIGGIIILMLWLYITGIVLVVGGQVNVAFQKRKKQLDSK
ncbi:putative ribonuclease-like protein YfkH [Kurthia zopfii]|uniref:Membrane protein n=1 Tax=Kurthia zopfii TaxID=1650 RepID=A0A8B4QDN7_9BACL|nr:YihY/virulence factor BrkB family protein [Kurthia zopfii]TDR38802.1 membrane protein [Kurthia zopfii]GEK31526.1 putative ribonuclease-like protein YfkH [Kurthia zopfii]STX10708.1 YihY family inner membrane protein [Kurthia zopfii]